MEWGLRLMCFCSLRAHADAVHWCTFFLHGGCMLLSFTSKRVVSLLLVGSLDTVFSNFKGAFSKPTSSLSNENPTPTDNLNVLCKSLHCKWRITVYNIIQTWILFTWLMTTYSHDYDSHKSDVLVWNSLYILSCFLRFETALKSSEQM